MTDAMSRFIAAESARLRAVGIPEARIAWLLGTKPANANRPLVPRLHGKRRPGRPLGAFGSCLRDAILAAIETEPRTARQLVDITRRQGGVIRKTLRMMEARGLIRRGRGPGGFIVNGPA